MCRHLNSAKTQRHCTHAARLDLGLDCHCIAFIVLVKNSFEMLVASIKDLCKW